jgi:hypothetical protein
MEPFYAVAVIYWLCGVLDLVPGDYLQCNFSITPSYVFGSIFY